MSLCFCDCFRARETNDWELISGGDRTVLLRFLFSVYDLLARKTAICTRDNASGKSTCSAKFIAPINFPESNGGQSKLSCEFSEIIRLLIIYIRFHSRTYYQSN